MKLSSTSLVVMAATLLAVSSSASQSPASGAHRSFETRAELEAAAQRAESGNRSGEAALIRSRLTRGDFQAGDRVLVTIEGAGGFTDTLMVESGPRLPVPQLGELPLDGVLRSELVPRLKAHVANYLKTATVRATPMVRLAVLGSVSRPGFYYTFADVPISDAVMAAGGPTGDADVARIEVTRGPAVIVSPATMRSAMADGSSIDALHLRAGDEVHVGKKKQFNTGTAVSITSALIGVIAAFAAFRR
jgi:hypothetical protein